MFHSARVCQSAFVWFVKWTLNNRPLLLNKFQGFVFLLPCCKKYNSFSHVMHFCKPCNIFCAFPPTWNKLCNILYIVYKKLIYNQWMSRICTELWPTSGYAIIHIKHGWKNFLLLLQFSCNLKWKIEFGWMK